MTETIFDHDRLPMKINIVAESHAKYDATPDYDYEHHCVEHEGKIEKSDSFQSGLDQDKSQVDNMDFSWWIIPSIPMPDYRRVHPARLLSHAAQLLFQNFTHQAKRGIAHLHIGDYAALIDKRHMLAKPLDFIPDSSARFIVLTSMQFKIRK